MSHSSRQKSAGGAAGNYSLQIEKKRANEK